MEKSKNLKAISKMLGHMCTPEYVSVVLKLHNLNLISGEEVIDAIGLIGSSPISVTSGTTANPYIVKFGETMSGDCGD